MYNKPTKKLPDMKKIQLSYSAQDGQAWLFWDIVNNKLLNITVAGIANSAGGPNLLTSRGTNDFIFVSSRNEFIYTTADTTENWAASNVTANVTATAVPEPSSFLMLATSIPLALFAVRRRRPLAQDKSKSLQRTVGGRYYGITGN